MLQQQAMAPEAVHQEQRHRHLHRAPVNHGKDIGLVVVVHLKVRTHHHIFILFIAVQNN